MEAYRSPIILGFIGLYMVMCIAVGLWAMRRTKSTKDFFMAGRNLGVFVTSLAVFSSTLSGFGFVGGPGLVYTMGMSSIWMVICASIGYCLSFYLLGKRIRMIAEVRDTVSLPDAVAARYSSESSRMLTGIAILMGVMGYLATQILAMATVLKDIIESSSESITSFSLGWSIAISCFFLVFYCVTGGIIASVYTDVVQGSVMIIAAVLVFFTTLNVFDGGAPEAIGYIMNDDSEAIGPWGTFGLIGCMGWYFMFTLGGAGQPHVVTKMMMNRRVEDVRAILPITLGSYAVSALLWISIGLVMRALVISGRHPALASGDQAASQFLQAYANPVLAGIVFAGLFAAIMSTADGFLNIGAAAIVHDIPKAIIGRSLKNELRWARIATVFIAVAAGSFAWYASSQGDLVALLGAFGWGTFAAALVPAVAIGFNWKRATALACNSAMLSGLVISLGVEVLSIPLPYGFPGGALALIVSLTLFFGISLASKPPKIDPDIEAVMDL